MALNRKNTKGDFVKLQVVNHVETAKKREKLPKVKADSKAKNEHPRQN